MSKLWGEFSKKLTKNLPKTLNVTTFYVWYFLIVRDFLTRKIFAFPYLIHLFLWTQNILPHSLLSIAKMIASFLIDSYQNAEHSNCRPGLQHYLKKRLRHRCFPVNFAKFLRTPFSLEHLWTKLFSSIKLAKGRKITRSLSFHSKLGQSHSSD